MLLFLRTCLIQSQQRARVPAEEIANQWPEYFPQWKGWFDYVWELYRGLMEQVDGKYQGIKHLQDQREYAKVIILT